MEGLWFKLLQNGHCACSVALKITLAVKRNWSTAPVSQYFKQVSETSTARMRKPVCVQYSCLDEPNSFKLNWFLHQAVKHCIPLCKPNWLFESYTDQPLTKIIRFHYSMLAVKGEDIIVDVVKTDLLVKERLMHLCLLKPKGRNPKSSRQV